MEATKSALQEPVIPLEVDKLPGEVREWMGELRVMVAASDLFRLAAIKRIQQVKQYCLERRVSWERICEERLPKCRKTIDHYIETLETFGDGTYETIIELSTHAEQVAARRLLKDGTIRHENGAIVISGTRILNDAAHAYQIVEVLREAIARGDAAVIEAAREKDLRMRQAETSEKRENALHELLDAQAAKFTRQQALPTPAALQTDQERAIWLQLREWQTGIEVLVGRLRAINQDAGHSGAFWVEIMTWLALQLKLIEETGWELADAHGHEMHGLIQWPNPTLESIDTSIWEARSVQRGMEETPSPQPSPSGRGSQGEAAPTVINGHDS